MNILKLVEKSAKSGVYLFVEGGGLRFKLSVETFPPALKTEILKHKPELITFLSGDSNSEQLKIRPKVVRRKDRKTALPTSFAQQRLWFIDQLQGSSVEYNMPAALNIDGDFDVDVAEQAIMRIIQRHESLRTVFKSQGENTLQVIQAQFDFKLTCYNLMHLDDKAQRREVNALVTEDRLKAFDLSQDLMVRVSYIQLCTEENSVQDMLLLNMHHIASDGWSMGILLKEFVIQYKALVQGEADPLPPLTIQYADYAHWQREYLEGEVLETQLNYWMTQLADIPSMHALPLDYPRPEMKAHQGAIVTSQLDNDLAQRLKKVASEHQLTPFMLLHGALALALSRHSSSQDIVIGTPVANRMQAELEPLIGFFVNTLVLRADTHHENLTDYFAHIRKVNLDAQAHQDIQFEQLVEHCNVPRSLQHTPLFQIMFSMDTNEQNELMIPGVSFTPIEDPAVVAKFDLNVSAQVTEDGIYFSWVYDTSLFSQAHIETLSQHLNRLLEGMLVVPTAKLCDLPLLSGQEMHYLTHELNDTQVDYPQDKLIHELFEEQAAINPNKIAAVFDDKQLTYQELNEASNRLAHCLLKRGFKKGSCVGIYGERSLMLMVSLLGIMKSGAAYVVLDPNLPEERLAYLIDNASIKIVLSPSDIIERVSIQNVEVLLMNGAGVDGSWLEEFSIENPAVPIQLNDLLYVLYTSGSTGQPKGVEVMHRSVLDYCLYAQKQYYKDVDGAFVVTSPSFDISVPSLYLPLIIGDKVELLDNSDPLTSLISRLAVVDSQRFLLRLTPMHVQTLLSLLPKEVNSGRHVFVVGGESFSPSLADMLQRHFPDSQIYNHYGPTEATVGCTLFDITAVSTYLSEYKQLPIGRPMDNTQLYVLDDQYNLLTFGIVGELYIGGKGLARGYLNKPTLTAERFIQNPFSDNANDRLYKTGDLVRYLPDGNIEFIGRTDDQVKIRGFRIELGEIENQLLQNNDVAASLVIVREDEPGEKRLVAYVIVKKTEVQDEAVFIDSLRECLKKSLPDYMLPSAFVTLDQFPLTPNGKVDKKALPAPDGSHSQSEYVAPENDTESTLVEIWAKLLKLDADIISVTANFFSLGGHSLLAIRLVSEIRTQLQQELALKVIFESPTIQTLALQIDVEFNTPLREIIKRVIRQPGEPMISSFAQQRLWFIDQLQGGSAEYNMAAALKIDGDFDVNAAEQAIRRIIQRHESLRTVFDSKGENTLQVIQAQFDFKLTRHNLTSLDDKAQRREVNALVTEDRLKAFDLSQDLMVRVAHIQLGTEENSVQDMLLFNLHHIASDGWSMGVLLKEFVIQYQAIVQGEADPLPPLTIQYADYAHWQREYLKGEVLETQLNYWMTQLADTPSVHTLPLDYPRSEMKSHQGAIVTSQLDTDLAQRLKQVASEHQLTPFMLLHGALALVLSRHSNSQDIVIGTPVANRMQTELEPLIGFFINALVLRADTHHENLTDYFAHIRKINLDAQAHQDIPFEQLVEHCNVSRSTQHAPLFQITFSMNTNEQSELTIPGVSFTPIEDSEVVAKFDLEIRAQVTENGIYLLWGYDTSLFIQAHIDTLSENLNRLLTGILTTPTAKLSDLPLLSTQEIHYLTQELNDTQVDYPQDKLIHELFEEQAASNPNNIAVVFEDKQMTYQALNEASNRLAYYLREQGVEPETLVGLCVERSLEMVIGILGILKAGGAYVPLDPAYPNDRLQYMINDCKAKYILKQSGVMNDVVLSSDIKLTNFDSEVEQLLIKSYPCANLENHVLVSQPSPSSPLAYVIYTSGTTGQPKGVMTEHSSVIAYNLSLKAQFELLEIQTTSPWIWSASFAFDASVKGLLSLSMGRRLIIASEIESKDPQALTSLIQNHGVEVYNSNPQMIELLLENLCEMDTVAPHLIVSGEHISAPILSKLLSYSLIYSRKVINAYGPTEGTINSTFGLIENQLSIGRPISNTTAYVLGSDQEIIPKGSIGELYIGGAGLARGYLNQPELTKERFIKNPFSDSPFSDNRDDRLYKTGDLVRYLPDGNIEFIGRIDDQVKIRGFRIELGEIQHQLLQNNDVAASVVIVREDEPGEKRLVAYVVPKKTEVQDEAVFIDSLRECLEKTLPDYMLPSAFVTLDQFPLTPNGKVDKKALPAPDGSNNESEYVAPDNDTEKTLVEIWAKLLKLDADIISVTADFFALGGHSLLSIRLVSEIRTQLQQELTVKVIFESPTIQTLALQIEGGFNAPLRKTVTRVIRQTGEPIISSFAQQRLWFIDQLQGGSAEYNMAAALKIDGDFDVNAAEQAIRRIIQRHESLRTVFDSKGENTLQVIQAQFDFKLTRHNLTSLDDKLQRREVNALVTEDRLKSFDLSQDLMVRVAHIQLGTEENSVQDMLLFNMHHIASDGWSMGILLKEFVIQYQAIVQDEADPLPPLTIQYADYAHWQREYLEGEVLETQLNYWVTQLADVPTVHDLPLNYPRPEVQTHQGAVVTSQLENDSAQRLKQLANEYQMTPFMLLHAALSLVLSRHSNSQDIVIGTPLANRMQAEIEPLIGFFVNTLMLRADTDHENLTDYFAHIRKINLDAQGHQDIPFEQLVEHCKIPRSLQHTPLFQILFSMNTSEQNDLTIPGVSFTPVESPGVVAKFDLHINAQVTENGIYLSWIYDTSLFSQVYIETLSEHLNRLLRGMLTTSTSKLCDLPMLSAQETHYLANELNDTHLDYPRDKLIHELFEEQAAINPDNLAVVFEDKQMTYQELNVASNQLAHYIREQGVKTETLVGICVERSLEMVIGILAILKAGGAYLPIDSNYPQARIKYLLEDSEIKLVLTQTSLLEQLPMERHQLVCLDTYNFGVSDSGIVSSQLTENISKQKLQLNSSHLAYAIYTSGSTGQPNGVLQSHRTVVNLVHSCAENDGIAAPLRTLQFASISFDISIHELATCWKTGSSLFLISQSEKDNLNLLPDILKRKSIERLYLPPTVLMFISEQIQRDNLLLPDLKQVFVAGEAISMTPAIRDFLQRHSDCQLWNHYGPSESHVATTAYLNSYVDSTSLPIGKPIANTTMYVLDNRKSLVPTGCIGELYIGGECLAQGYLNRPELTKERFLRDPFSDNPNDRLYKTGDLVRYLPDGSLEFLGRIDDQVKIRGFRIELGEIENQLSQNENVTASLVLVREDEPGEKRLVAYVVAKETEVLDEVTFINSLRDHLQTTLPDFMLPSAFVILEQFVLTPNGKVDKKALPAPDNSNNQGEYIAPENDTEKTLVKIWAKLLKLDADTISVTTNFFALGGHSLLAVRLVSEIRTQLQKELAIKVIFESPCIQTLALQIEGKLNASLRKMITTVSRQSDEPIISSFAQQRLWFIDQLQEGSVEYNMPAALNIDGDFDVDVAEQAIKRIIQRHESLRTVFKATDDIPLQVIQAQFDFRITRYDLTHLDEKVQLREVNDLVIEDSLKVFDLSQDLMVRVSYVHLGTEEHPVKDMLLINMHHIASDGWSMGVLLKEFVLQYQAILQGEADPLPPLLIQYADYAQWQREYLVEEVLEAQLSYWSKQLAEVPVVHGLPLNYTRPEIKSHQGAVVTSQLDNHLAQQLKQVANEHQLTPFMILHAALSLVLSQHSNSQDIVIGTPVANRMQAELEPLIGFFVNTLVLRVDTNHKQLTDYFAHVREINVDAQAHQDIPFEQLVEHCNVPRSLQHAPLFQITFNMNTNEQSELTIPGVSFTPVEGSSVVAKFDLNISAQVTDNGIYFSWVYDVSLFSQAYIETLSEHLNRLLAGMLAAPTAKLCDLPMFSAQEIHYLTHELNNTQVDYPQDKLIHELFEEQTASNPNNIAVVFEDKQITYQELNEASNQLAHYLITQRQVKPDTLVGICVERSLDMMIGILGILKAGGAYVPLDSSYPKARLAYMLADAKLDTVITQTHLREQLSISEQCAVCLDDEIVMKVLGRQAIGNIFPHQLNLHSDHLAYVIYTSGSTGEPKGVMIEHSGVVNMVQGHQRIFKVSENSRVLNFSSLSFDAGVWEWTMALFNGAALYICSNEDRLSPEKLQNNLISHAISHVLLPPALLNHLELSDEYKFDCLIIGGDSCDESLAQKWAERYNMYNAYGPTESSVCVSVGAINADSKLIIGQPIINVQLHVLNQTGQLLPAGTIGELYIGGAGLARGYLNQPQLTQERFIQRPVKNEINERLYKTGDLVRRLPDGNIEFIGRVDEQVKIRGFRIELGEIEFQLSQCEGIAASVVLAREDGAGLKSLVAYLVPDHQNGVVLDQQEMISVCKDHLRAQLPNYMVPSGFVIVDQIPLSPNGKVDKNALPAPNKSHMLEGYIAPETQEEKILVEIWSKLLKLDIENISANDDFFYIGGNSLLIISLIRELSLLGFENIKITNIYESSTIKEMAIVVGNSLNKSKSILVDLNKAEDKEKLFVIHPGGGRVDCYQKFAADLDEKFHILGVESFVYSNREVRFKSLKELAQLYVSEIQLIQSGGTYNIAGWSSGGEVACYIAELLTKQGFKVKNLFLFDPTKHFNGVQKSMGECIMLIVYYLVPEEFQLIQKMKELIENNHDFNFLVNKLAQLLHPVESLYDNHDSTVCFIFALYDYYSAKRDSLDLSSIQLINLIAPGINNDNEKMSFNDTHKTGDSLNFTIVNGTHDKMMEEPCLGEIVDIIKNNVKD